MAIGAGHHDGALDALLGSDRGNNTPGTVYVSLWIGDPLAGGSEPSGGSYARVSKSNNDTHWAASTGGVKANNSEIQFPTATGAWGDLTHWALMSHSTNDDPDVDLYISGTLDVTISPLTGDAPFFAVGDLEITCA